MKRKRKGFTLVELLIVLSIGAVLLTISTNRFILNTAVANNNNNKQIDLQSGVSATMEMVKNTLRKTTQVHLVDRSVYDPDLPLSNLESRGLDTKYNYIAIHKDPTTGEKTLVNLLYNKTKNGGAGGFEMVPIIAADKGDRIRPVNVNFALDLYAGDDEYKTKMKKNIINIKITGTARDVDQAGNFTNPQDDKVFSLQEDIFLQNANQILISRHMTGGLADVTAIAYDSAVIDQERTDRVKNMSFVFVIDVSGSMSFSMNNHVSTTYQNSRKKIARDSIHDFITKLNQQGKDNDIDIKSYIFTYGSDVMLGTPSLTNNPSPEPNYIYNLETLERHPSKKYGPFKMGKSSTDADVSTIRDHLDNDAKCAMNKHITSNGTNTGKALLQSLEMLNQLKKRDSKEKRFLILLTDGAPQMVYTNLPRANSTVGPYIDGVGNRLYNTRRRIPELEIVNRATYDSRLTNNYFLGDNVYVHNPHVLALEYIEAVTKYESGNNLPDTFDKAYLIAFSGVTTDKQMLGLAGTNYGSHGSIRKFLAQEGTSHEKSGAVLTYDAASADALNSAFADITKSIGNVMGVFDGPDKLRR